MSILINLAVILGASAPLMLLESLRSRSAWLERNHDWLSIVVWALTLVALYVWVFPRFGLFVNPRLRDALPV